MTNKPNYLIYSLIVWLVVDLLLFYKLFIKYIILLSTLQLQSTENFQTICIFWTIVNVWYNNSKY